MSREIKFRAWDKINEKIVKISSLSLENKEIAVKENGTYHFFRMQNLELMQYTGLNDKNGKEIYEGDIIKYKFPYDRRLKHISPVFYMESQASYGVLDIYKNGIPLYTMPANNYFEVIGNIYENPELLEENK